LKRLLRAAVEAYLDEPTWARAAQRAGIARSTFCIWMKLPEFRRLADQILQKRFLNTRTQDKAAEALRTRKTSVMLSSAERTRTGPQRDMNKETSPAAVSARLAHRIG
jgi:hypothetical protein